MKRRAWKFTTAIAKDGGKAAFFRCDVSNAEQVKVAIATTAKQNGRIDVLINNAAYIAKTWHSSGEAPEEEWEKSFRISLFGTQLCTREVLPFMVKQSSGSIINISSIQGMVAGRSSAAYVSIKHALVGFTRSVAYDYGKNNIRCNALCPGAPLVFGASSST